MKGLKKLLSVVTAAAMGICCMNSAAVSVSGAVDWDGQIDVSWYNKTDTSFTLTEPEELAGLAKLVNDKTDNFAGKTIYLGSDVVFYEFADQEAWSEGIEPPNSHWTPIGNTYGTPFKGTFDGCGYSISGLYIYTTANAAGFFGYAGSGSVICNLTLENSYIHSVDTFAGGIVGYNHIAEVVNCINKAMVCAEYYVAGGVSGVNAGGITENCVNTGKVIGCRGAGGILGEQCSSGKMNACYNTGIVISESCAGGIAGKSSDNTISNCYNLGSISGYTYAGGITGQSSGNSDLSNCYSTGTVINYKGTSGGVTGDDAVNCVNCYYLKDSAESGCASKGVEVFTEDALTDGSLTESLDIAYVQGENHPILTWQNGSYEPPSTETTAGTTTITTTIITTTTETTDMTTSVSGKIKIWAINNDTTLEGIGDTVQLLIDGNTSTPQWATMDAKTATVDETGKVTASGIGTVTIVAIVDGIAVTIELVVTEAGGTTASTETTTTTTTTTTGKTTTTTGKTTAASNTTTSVTTATIKAYSQGDCDGNRVVDIADATAVLQYYAFKAAGLEVAFDPDENLDTLAFYAADINHDGEITIDDATKILVYYAQKAAGLDAVWE